MEVPKMRSIMTVKCMNMCKHFLAGLVCIIIILIIIIPLFISLETHRFLCVMLWILDCMKLESPQYMPALSTYFRINR